MAMSGSVAAGCWVPAVAGTTAGVGRGGADGEVGRRGVGRSGCRSAVIRQALGAWGTVDDRAVGVADMADINRPVACRREPRSKDGRRRTERNQDNRFAVDGRSDRVKEPGQIVIGLGRQRENRLLRSGIVEESGQRVETRSLAGDKTDGLILPDRALGVAACFRIAPEQGFAGD